MFEGIIVALVTPLRDNRVDVDGLRRLIEYQIEHGVHGIVPCGTTGESATLSHDEHRAVIQHCIEIVGGRVPVIAGTGSNSTAESVALTRFAREAGADGALLITPYYNKPTQEGLVRHYQTIAESVELPLVLYNVPGRTALDMKPETVARLAELPNIVAIKEATADMERALVIRSMCGEKLTLLSGDDATLLPFLAIGGRGIISVTANVAPGRMVALWNRWERDDAVGALREHETLLHLHRAMFVETNPIPVKAAAAMLGLCGGEIRLPLTPLSAGHHATLRRLMTDLALFDVVNGHESSSRFHDAD
ncbi:MAG: 4-hydroxy-tetrahydrodipicolinate synthase [Magnetococcales bacterium]|nr:4-hydroxy-tetrahydrodipicolinate synthase [Magnetococcales bacterium]